MFVHGVGSVKLLEGSFGVSELRKKTAIVQLTIAVFEFARFCSDSPHPNRIFAERNATWPFTPSL